MADGIAIPVQVKIHVQEMVKTEFEIQNIIQDIRKCYGPLSLLNDINLKVKQKLNSLRQKVEVRRSSGKFLQNLKLVSYYKLVKSLPGMMKITGLICINNQYEYLFVKL